MNAQKISRPTPWLVVALAAPAAQAHTLALEGVGLLSGLAHPWLGPDHALAMLAVGLWARQQGDELVLRLPLVFLLLMVVGTGLARWNLPLPALEAGLASFVLVLGLLWFFALRLPATAGVALVGTFAVLHGHAHGAEMPGSASMLAYVSGFVVATGSLHALGIATGSALGTLRSGMPLRLAGAAITAGDILLWG